MADRPKKRRSKGSTPPNEVARVRDGAAEWKPAPRPAKGSPPRPPGPMPAETAEWAAWMLETLLAAIPEPFTERHRDVALGMRMFMAAVHHDQAEGAPRSLLFEGASESVVEGYWLLWEVWGKELLARVPKVPPPGEIPLADRLGRLLQAIAFLEEKVMVAWEEAQATDELP